MPKPSTIRESPVSLQKPPASVQVQELWPKSDISWLIVELHTSGPGLLTAQLRKTKEWEEILLYYNVEQSSKLFVEPEKHTGSWASPQT